MVGTLTISTIYLDWAAAAPPNRQALRLWQAMSRDYFANPNSLHDLGREAQGTMGPLAPTVWPRGWLSSLTSYCSLRERPPPTNWLSLWPKTGILNWPALATDHDSICLSADQKLSVQPETGTVNWAKIELDDEVGLVSLAGIIKRNRDCPALASGQGGLRRIRDDRQKRGCSRPLWLHIGRLANGYHQQLPTPVAGG